MNPRRLRRGSIEALPAIALLPAFLVASLFIAAAGVSPIAAGEALINGSLSDIAGLGVTAVNTAPLLLTGLGIAIGIRCGLWNLGGEGQIYIGALFAAAVALYVIPDGDGMTKAVVFVIGVPLSIAAGFAGGALWASVPAYLRAYRNVSEVITSLLLNFVAINLVTIMVQGPLQEEGLSFPGTETVPSAIELPTIIPGTQAHAGLLIALALAAALYAAFDRTSFGLELRAVGLNPRAAHVAGIQVRRRIVQAMVFSGGFAGVAGAIELVGRDHRLVKEFSPGYGFDAIAVALLGAGDPRFIVPAAVFFGALRAGAPAMERQVALPSELMFLTQGVLILFVIAAYGLRTRLRRKFLTPAVEA